MQFFKRVQTWIDTTDVAERRLPGRWLAIVSAAAACLLLAPWGGVPSLIESGMSTVFNETQSIADENLFLTESNLIGRARKGAGGQSASGIRGAAMVIDPDPGNPISQPGPRIRYRPNADASESSRVSSGPASSSRVSSGRASYYGFSLAGNPTASGERFDPNDLTAAHPTLPFGTRVRVTNLANDRSVIVRINDRGPFVRRRIIDVSRAAADRLGMLRAGVTNVRLAILEEE